MGFIKYIKVNRYKAALILILALAGFLSLYAVGQEGYANQYYSAAVKSMLTSWHNFFFASFDAGGYVTVDKPALGLWLQAISAFIFGFHGWSLILPEALSTLISVCLVYHLVQRYFGKPAGIISALILSLTPILIAVSRTNNLDASLVMVVLFATWAMVVAAERGSFKLLLLSVALIGLGFNIKMLEAFMVLPALYLVYFLTAPLKLGKKIIHLAAATAVLLTVSLSWAVIVDLTPADSRPYVGGSKTNSVIELALGYNGIQRITGTQGNLGGVGGQVDGGLQRDDGGRNIQGSPPTDGSAPGGSPGGVPGGIIAGPHGQDDAGFNANPDGQGGAGFNAGLNGGPGGVGENGQKGILRVLDQQLAGQISWFLVMAAFGLLMLGLRTYKNPSKDKKAIQRHLILWAACIVPMLGYFSVAGFFHRYYLSMLAPSIAALSGIGIVEMWKAYRGRGWKWAILPAALIAAAAMQAKILWNYTEWRGVLIPVVCGLAGLSAASLIIIRLMKKDNLDKTIKVVLALGIAALLIAPSIWSYTPIMYGSQTTLPIAGPELKTGSGDLGRNMDGANIGRNNASSQLVDFLLSKKQNEKYLVAVADANSAASIILQTGEAVMAVGGFSGSDNILTVDRLSQMVKDGELRYFQIGGRGMGQQSEITAWVEAHGKVVTIDNSSGGSSFSDGTLYDLAPEKG